MVPIRTNIDYLINCKRYVSDMRTKMRELDVVRVDVEDRMNLSSIKLVEIPFQVRGWLEQVEAIKANVEKFPNDVSGCCSLWTRHKLGNEAVKIIKEIENIIKQHHMIIKEKHHKVTMTGPSKKPSTSAPSSHDDFHDFQSRAQIFTEALEALGPGHRSHMIALCGMGGVGKTTMMKKLNKVVQEKKMYDYIIEVAIGETTDPCAIQQIVSECLAIELKESSKQARAYKLRRWFEAHSDGGKTKFLVIIDDLWESVDLEDIGLSPFPNQGVDYKVLLISRNLNVFREMGVELNSILAVHFLTDVESRSMFRQCVNYFDDADHLDPVFHEIADNIASRCRGWPIAIKTIASSLRVKNKHVWEDAMARLEHLELYDFLQEVFKLSYDNLVDKETESIFLLCGLFPRDIDIPIEELLRYGWGLRLFIRVSSIREARYKLHICIKRLIDTNLLIKSDDGECVKMHDLVHAFVLYMLSKAEHASVVNHGRMTGWPQNDMISKLSNYQRVSLTCKGMLEFPRDLKFPNVSILKLMHGDKSLKFPHDFYEEMEKLQVISYQEMKYPLLPSSLQCSTNLRVLHLNQCSLMFDCSYIGNLLNLEVLSFANSAIEWLPTPIGNLKKLRILDLRGCGGLRIDNGVLEKLVILEELYATASRQYGKAIRFTKGICNEMETLSRKLSVLEFEFFENNAQPKNMLFENLERFKISVGRSLAGDYRSRSAHSSENILKLVTSTGELLNSRMNELFPKTEVLCLSVEDMHDLEDVEVKSLHPPRSSYFNKVRFLVVSRCSELRYLFTFGVAKAFPSLEHLEVFDCPLMKVLIHNEDSGPETIRLPMLKFLSLGRLPKLLDLCHKDNANMIQLPQLAELELGHILRIYPQKLLGTSCFFNEEVFTPNLKTLQIKSMENLKEIWPSEFRTSEEVLLREIRVGNCYNLLNIFPCNPMSMLPHLEKLQVWDCSSIEVIFNINLDGVGVGVGEIEQGSNSSSSSSSLRSIDLDRLENLREVWRIRGADSSCVLVRGFQAVESIRLWGCERFRNVFTPTTTNFDLGALTSMNIKDCTRNNDSLDSSQEEQVNILSKEEFAFPSHLIKSCHKLQKLKLKRYKGVDAVFEMKSPASRDLFITTDHHNQQPLLHCLKELDIRYMDTMRYVWKWSNLYQPSESPFHNLTTICIYRCTHIMYLFSSFIAKLLSNLKKVHIEDCDAIETVVLNDEDCDVTHTITNTTFFPDLTSLTLSFLPNLSCIGGGHPNAGNNEVKLAQVGDFWSLCQYSREINISCCDALSSVIPSYALGEMQKLEVLRIRDCTSMKQVFETQKINNSCDCDEEIGSTPPIPQQLNVIMLQLRNLKILGIGGCDLLEYIFTFSTLESLLNLEQLLIYDCKAISVIVKKEEVDGEQTTRASSMVVVFPRLRSIELVNLPELKGFFLENNEFRWPSLNKVTIADCPQMMVFTPGCSTAPRLEYIETSLGTHDVEEFGLNFNSSHNQTPFPSLASTSSAPATSKGVPWSYHNLIKMDVRSNRSIQKIFPFSELLHLQKLEKIRVSYCHGAEEVFEAWTNSSSNFVESKTVVILPNLKQVELEYLDGLRYIWRSNQWTVLEFPNLTTLSIYNCNSLGHVFTSSMCGNLMQLQELRITSCESVDGVIVSDTHVAAEEDEEEESDGETNVIVLPRLKTIKLDSLPCLRGFYLGKEDFSFPLLDTLRIKKCTELTTFTKGRLATPKLKEIETSFGSFYAGEDINSFLKNKQEEFRRDEPWSM